MDRLRGWFGQSKTSQQTTDANNLQVENSFDSANSPSTASAGADVAAAVTVDPAPLASSSDSSSESTSSIEAVGHDQPSTSQSDEPDNVNPMLQTSLTKRFQGKFQPLQMPTYETMMQEDFMNNCAVRSTIAGTMGGMLGVAFGVFTASLDTQGIDTAPLGETKPTRVVLRETWQLMKEKSRSYAKGFAGMGFLYSGTECMIERYRAKHDAVNATLAGCATGGLMAAPGGAKAMCFGCASFAAFSTAIEYFTGGL